jgi:uncharacterized membrane protein
MFYERAAMVKKLSKYFLRGLLTFMPFALTVYAFIMLVVWSENFTARTVTWFLDEAYIPGMGLALSVAVIIFMGFVVSHPGFNKFVDFIELPFKNVPFIKTIYSALRNLSDYFSPGAGNRTQQVVLVKIPNAEIEIIGFLTRQNFSDLPKDLQFQGKVAVYIPLSYQVGGYTAFVPKTWIKPLDVPVELAMRSTLFAWIQSGTTHDWGKKNPEPL